MKHVHFGEPELGADPVPRGGRGAGNPVLGKEIGDLLSRGDGMMGGGPYKGLIL